MKKVILLFFAAAAALSMASCSPDGPDNPDPNRHPAVIRANYSALNNGTITGEELKVLPVSASSEAGNLDLKFFSDKIYLPAGTYTIGKEIGNYSGHFKNDWVDADIAAGMLTVTLEGEEDYAINGTVRLADEAGTAVKVRSNGKMVYEFPTEYYYTLTKNATVNGFTADVYKIYDIATSVQLAEVSVAGGDSGEFPVAGTGAAGTAIYGSPNAGSWLFIPGYGTHIMIHGSVSISQSHGKKNFVFTDTNSGAFNNCELKQDIVPALPASNNDRSFMMVKFYSVESPLIEGMYELTVKLYYTDGTEFLSFTDITATPNPALEAIEAKGKTGGMAYGIKPFDACLNATASDKFAVGPTCFYMYEGVKYEVPMDQGLFALINAKSYEGGIIAGLFIFMDAGYGVPEPLFTILGGDPYAAIGYYM